MECHVYRCRRRAETYVYLRARDAGASLPPALLHSLGPLLYVLSFDLTPERRLAREDARVVYENLSRVGFHVQFPPVEPFRAD